jgi:hypothetical protein
MFRIVFCQPRQRRPLAIGALCHLGLGLFVLAVKLENGCMIATIENRRQPPLQLCQRYRVQRLEVFGSAATENASLIPRLCLETRSRGGSAVIGVAADRAGNRRKNTRVPAEPVRQGVPRQSLGTRPQDH